MTKRERYLREAEQYDAKAEETADDEPATSEYYSRAASGLRCLAAHTPPDEEVSYE